MLTSISSSFTACAQSSRLGRLGKGLTQAGMAVLLGLAASVAGAQTADGSSGIDATGNAKSEMAACNSGKTQQSRTTCLTEVRNANADKRAGKLGNGDGQFMANAMKRCEVFKDANDQTACKARVSSDATLQGSVASGGLLREAETTVPAGAQ